MTDRFDTRVRLRRVGVHRAPETRWWRWWMTAIVAVAACVVLTAAGLWALSSLRADDAPTPTLAEQPDPLTDPSALPDDVTVSVLDGTGDAEAATAVAASLTDAGWPVAAEASADESLDETIVYYAGDDLQAAALGLVAQLGTGTVVPVEDPIAGTPLTVALGADALAATPSESEAQPEDAP